MDLKLKNKVVFIAGSSKGIGLAIAQAFAKEGAKVAITGRDSESLEKARHILGEGNDVLKIHGDMANPKTIDSALKKAVSHFGEINIVIANIGSGTGKNGFDLKFEDWQSMLATNLIGSMMLASKSIPYLTKQGGSIVFISSIVGIETVGGHLPYTAAKAGLLHAMKQLSREVADKNIRVNAVAPGNILFPGGSWEKNLAKRKEFFKKYIAAEVPMQRFGKPEEVADAVLFLSSEKASFITGACLVVDGGQTRSL
ncbi:SDR family oxidoreductase [Candidatus Woesearchaeota archaeon]|nr:SDR family oxidoreductase [Candidatus Woesearchaeota archaeon]